jgi:redox-regulated HSP33 family molecular chaperone
VVGRVFLDNVKQTETSQLFVEIQRRGRTPYRSAIEVEGLDVFEIFEQYFSRSEQVNTKFYEVSDTDFVMFQALPDVDSEWLGKLDRDAALDAIESPTKKLDTQIFNFRCGCDVDRMTKVVKGMYADQPNELFQGDDRVEVVCPRCGHKWWLNRDGF